MVSGLAGHAPQTVVDHLRDMYAGLPSDYMRNLGCIGIPITGAETIVPLPDGTTNRAYTFVQPTGIGATGMSNASLHTNYAMLARCESVMGITGIVGQPRDSQLDQWVMQTLSWTIAATVNTWYMGGEAIARAGDFAIEYANQGSMRVVRDIKARDAATRTRLNQAARNHGLTTNIVSQSKHLVWSPNTATGPVFGVYLPASLVRGDAPSVREYEAANPEAPRLLEDAVGDLLVKRGDETLTVGDSIVVPRGGADYTINSGANTNTVPNDGDTVALYQVTAAGRTANVTRESLASATLEDVARLVTEGKLASVGQALPTAQGVEDPGLSAHLEAGNTYVVTLRDNVPGGTAYRARSFDTTAPPLPPQLAASDLGVVVGRYVEPSTGNMVDVVLGATACLPSGRAIAFIPLSMGPTIETRGDVLGVGQTVDASDPFASAASDLETPLELPAGGASLVQYVRRSSDGATATRTFPLAACASAPVVEPPQRHQQPVAATRNADPVTFVGMDDVPGTRRGNEHGDVGASYTTVTMTRPTAASEAEIDTHALDAHATARVDIGAPQHFALLARAGYQHMTGDVAIGGTDRQDITDNMAAAAVGPQFLLVSPSGNAFHAYVLARGYAGSGDTETDLPSAADGTRRTLDTTRNHLGGGVEGGLAARVGRFVAEAAASYAAVGTEEHAAFSSARDSEVTDSHATYLDVSAYVGARLMGGRVVPIIGGEVRHETQHADVNGFDASYTNARLDAGARLTVGDFSGTLLVGYDANGALRIYDAVDIADAVSLYASTNIQLGDRRDTVRRDVDIARNKPPVNAGLELYF